jgi:aerobic-type carbon monoxide dehydrogenase small subunit (CoxS/CutS family)
MPDKNRKDNREGSKEGLGPISRRDFTIASVAVLGVGGSEATGRATTQTTGNAPGQAPAPQKIPSLSASDSARTIHFTVNKWKFEVKVEPESVLRDVLRDQLGFLSVKDMCNGYGACGSCTVIINGRPVLSCMTLAVECDGATIETAEGVAASNPQLIEAYVLNHCMQCGYCTPGFVVTAKALLDRNPKPSEKEIREAMGGNICRCGTYPQHILAVQEVTQIR